MSACAPFFDSETDSLNSPQEIHPQTSLARLFSQFYSCNLLNQ
uniref:Uncharacterized protein n=1 Tax=Manihot esculenta TaxID=3983 RepID=A0A2C9V692_MANES